MLLKKTSRISLKIAAIDQHFCSNMSSAISHTFPVITCLDTKKRIKNGYSFLLKSHSVPLEASCTRDISIVVDASDTPYGKADW